MEDIISLLQNNKDKVIAGKGVSSGQIIEAENELQVKFAQDFKTCLMTYGGFRYNGHEITGITENVNCNVVDITKQQRYNYPNIPATWYVIEVANTDNIIVWQDCDGHIHGTIMQNEPMYLANNLVEFLCQY